MKGSFSDILKEMDKDLRSRLAAKVPAWDIPGITVPGSLNAEQCSSQVTAMYKAGICKRLGAGKVADLTGGLGVDCWAFGTVAESVLYNEMDAGLCSAVRGNFDKLGVGNVVFRNSETRPGAIAEILDGFCPDLIFLDPARRSGTGKKVFLLEECSPDIVSLKDELLQACPFVLVKLSPMADISMAASRLGQEVREIHVLGAGGECKELLCLMQRGWCGGYGITVASGGAAFTFKPEDERKAVWRAPESAAKDRMLFVPGSAMLKAGPMNLLASEYGMEKLSRFTHMYFCDSAIEDLRAFGKFYHVNEIRPLNGQNLKQIGKEFPKCEVTARNIPMSSDQMLKKTGAASGGSAHIFGVTISWRDAAEGRYIIISNS